MSPDSETRGRLQVVMKTAFIRHLSNGRQEGHSRSICSILVDRVPGTLVSFPGLTEATLDGPLVRMLWGSSWGLSDSDTPVVSGPQNWTQGLAAPGLLLMLQPPPLLTGLPALSLGGKGVGSHSVNPQTSLAGALRGLCIAYRSPGPPPDFLGQDQEI